MSTPAEAGLLAPVKVGDVLAGKYEVERVLGSGGMGVVVAAKHVHLGERVAIKFLLEQALKNAEVVERFLREGRAAVRIKSEHVARVFDVGKLDDGAPYMVMEFLEGADLSTLLKARGPVAVETAVEYVLQACEAIAEAHSLGIIHRDLKPANLFVTRRADGSPVVKVIDFGISKVVDPTAGTDVEMTKTDVMMGSPVYMAPEQMISARDVDVRADVWSLGVILFCLVMGQQPFKGSSVTQLYASILEGPPSLRETRPDIAPELESAIRRCLQANPKDRWANVAELAAAIAELGPPQGRVSADRVSRTLGVTPAGPGTRSAPAGPGPGTRSAPAPARAGSVPPAAVAATVAVEGAEGSTGPGTDGSWERTKVSKGVAAPGRSRTVVIAVAAGVAVLGAAAAGALLFGRDGAGGGAGPAGSAEPAGGLEPQAAGSQGMAGGVAVTPSMSGASAGTAATARPSATAASAAATAASAAVTAASAAATAASAAVTAASAAAAVRPSATPGSAAPRPKGTSRPATTGTPPKSDPFSDPH